jgi:hypothetical protein
VIQEDLNISRAIGSKSILPQCHTRYYGNMPSSHQMLHNVIVFYLQDSQSNNIYISLQREGFPYWSLAMGLHQYGTIENSFQGLRIILGVQLDASQIVLPCHTRLSFRHCYNIVEVDLKSIDVLRENSSFDKQVLKSSPTIEHCC